MELKFINITKCTKSLYNKFLHFHIKKYKTENILKAIIITFFVLYMMIFNIIYHNYIGVISIMLISIIYLKYISKNNNKIIKKELESSKIKNEEEIKFCFYNRYFTININKQKLKKRYYKLRRITDDKENFYLYIDKTNAFIVSKSGFKKGTAKEFKTFIAKKCRFRYF